MIVGDCRQLPANRLAGQHVSDDWEQHIVADAGTTGGGTTLRRCGPGPAGDMLTRGRLSAYHGDCLVAALWAVLVVDVNLMLSWSHCLQREAYANQYASEVLVLSKLLPGLRAHCGR